MLYFSVGTGWEEVAVIHLRLESLCFDLQTVHANRDSLHEDNLAFRACTKYLYMQSSFFMLADCLFYLQFDVWYKLQSLVIKLSNVGRGFC